jgi:hypothetical protein
MLIYRFMERGSTDLVVLEEELQTDAEVGERGDGREKKYPCLLHTRSVFAPELLALRRWRRAKQSAERQRGDMRDRFLAEIAVGPDEGFFIEQAGNDGHMLIWGGKTELARKVGRVFEGHDETEEAT